MTPGSGRGLFSNTACLGRQMGARHRSDDVTGGAGCWCEGHALVYCSYYLRLVGHQRKRHFVWDLRVGMKEIIL